MNHLNRSTSSRALAYLVVGSAALLMLVSGCGGVAGTALPAPQTVNGVVMKGPVAAASVQLFAVDDFGNATGPVVNTVTTNANGAFVFNRAAGGPALLAVTSGGSFVDEADSETNPALKRRITLTAGQGFTSLLPAGSNSLIITPYTQALLLRARRLATSGGFASAFAALRTQAQSAMGFDPAGVTPEPPLSPAAGASTAAKQYAMAIGGAAQAMQAQALALGTVPSFDTINAFITDLSDGIVNGRLSGAPVTLTVRSQTVNLPTDIVLNDQIGRFRNNNFTAYTGVTAVVINQDLQSQPPPGFTPPSSAPVANADSIAVNEGATSTALVGGAASVLANDTPSTATLTARLETNVTRGLLTLNSNGTFSYSHGGGENTSDSFTYTAFDGTTRSAPATVSISVTPVNDAPVAVADTYSTTGPLTIAAPGVLGNDTDAESNTLTAAVVSPPASGTLSLSSTGAFTYTPVSTFSGAVTFTYRTTDSAGASSPAVTVTLNVAANNVAPTAVADAYTTAQGTALTQAAPGVLGNDTDPNSGDTLTATRVTNPASGTLSLNANGGFTYTPNAGFFGSDSFTYRAVDAAAANSNIVTVTLSVTAASAADIPCTNTAPNNSPWLRCLHFGGMEATANATQAKLNWVATAGVTYNLIVTSNPSANINNLGSGGGQRINNVTPTYVATGLTADTAYYFGLEANGALVAWTSAQLGPQRLYAINYGVADVKAITVGSDNTRYLGGTFGINSIRGLSAALLSPATGSGNGRVLALPQVVGNVDVVVPDGQGGFYLGGDFTSVGGQPRLDLAQVDSAGRVTGWNPGTNGSVSALLVLNDVVYVGGSFGTVAGVARVRLAAVDRSGALLGWNPGGSNNVVNALAAVGNVIYIGGSFTTLVGQPRPYLAAVDTAGVLQGWNPTANSTVNALAVQGSTIYAGGDFTTIGGVTRNHMAAIGTDGTLQAFDPNVDRTVLSIAIGDSGSGPIVYFGGSFLTVNGQSRRYLAAATVQGTVTGWGPLASNTVNSLKFDNNIIYIGGSFTTLGSGITRERLAAVTPTGNILPWNPSASSTVNTVTVADGVVLAGGSFIGLNPIFRSNLVAYDKLGNLTDWAPEANSVVNAMVRQGNVIYLGGSFSNVLGSTRNQLAAVNTDGTLAAWNPNVSGGFSSGPVVNGLLGLNGNVYVAGDFTSVGGQARRGLAAIDLNGAATTWNPAGTVGFVRAPLVLDAVDDPQSNAEIVYVGGPFASFNGTTRRGLAAFDATGALTAWNTDACSDIGTSNFCDVRTVRVEPSRAGQRVYFGGNFAQVSGQAVTDIAAVDATTGALVTGFNPGSNSTVNSIALVGDEVYVGGDFSTFGGQNRERLASVLRDGSFTNFIPGATSRVNTLFLAPGPDPVQQPTLLYVGGGFQTASGSNQGSGTSRRHGLAVFDLGGALQAP